MTKFSGSRKSGFMFSEVTNCISKNTNEVFGVRRTSGPRNHFAHELVQSAGAEAGLKRENLLHQAAH
eukprot:1335674-Rhodomonas_salina.2